MSYQSQFRIKNERLPTNKSKQVSLFKYNFTLAIVKPKLKLNLIITRGTKMDAKQIDDYRRLLARLANDARKEAEGAEFEILKALLAARADAYDYCLYHFDQAATHH